MSRLALLLYVLSSSALAITAWEPTVSYTGRSLTGVPATHHHPLGQGVEILSQDNCVAHARGPARVEVPERCEFLRGIYRYIFLPESGERRHQMLVEFSLSRRSSANYSFLVGSPIELEEPAEALP